MSVRVVRHVQSLTLPALGALGLYLCPSLPESSRPCHKFLGRYWRTGVHRPRSNGGDARTPLVEHGGDQQPSPPFHIAMVHIARVVPWAGSSFCHNSCKVRFTLGFRATVRATTFTKSNVARPSTAANARSHKPAPPTALARGPPNCSSWDRRGAPLQGQDQRNGAKAAQNNSFLSALK